MSYPKMIAKDSYQGSKNMNAFIDRLNVQHTNISRDGRGTSGRKKRDVSGKQ